MLKGAGGKLNDDDPAGSVTFACAIGPPLARMTAAVAVPVSRLRPRGLLLVSAVPAVAACV